MLHLKKPNRDDKRQLLERAPKRDGIRKESSYEKEGRKKKEDMISASRKRKQEALSGNAEEGDEDVKTIKSHKKKKKSNANIENE